MPGSNETLERLEEMERMLMRRKWTTTELAYEFGVDPSTIYRNIELLEAMGSPIEKDQDRRKGRRYWIDQQRFLNRVRVTLHEATALYLGARLLARMIDTSNRFVVTALHKLAEPLEIVAAVGGADGREAGGGATVRYNRWLAERRIARITDWLKENAAGRKLEIATAYAEDDPSRRVTIRLRAGG